MPSTVFVRLRSGNLAAASVGAADLVLVARDQHAILRRYQIGLDEVGTHLGGQTIAGERVLRGDVRSATVTDDERFRRVCRRQA